jgi:hypothetical protein
MCVCMCLYMRMNKYLTFGIENMDRWLGPVLLKGVSGNQISYRLNYRFVLFGAERVL